MSRLIARARFGSHLYGTATATSDEDWRGVFLPEVRDLLLGRVPKTRGPDAGSDLDLEDFSLHHFVKLACQGQTLAIDMLWAPPHLVERGPFADLWDELVAERSRFLSKNMTAFVGYARSQAAKYSLKGERLARLRKFAEVLHRAPSELGPMSSVWEDLPRDAERTNPNGIVELQIAGKWFGATTRIDSALGSVETQLARYGRRAESAQEGSDWKAMSHAVRVANELEELLETGGLEFPLRSAPELLEIKRGAWPLERVQARLDEKLARIEGLVEASDLPDEVDAGWWDDWLVRVLGEQMRVELG